MRGKIWGRPSMSCGPFRHYPPGGTARDPLPAYTRSDFANVTFDFKPEGNNNDAFARMRGLPYQEDWPLTPRRLEELREFVRRHEMKWHRSPGTRKWYCNDEPWRGFANEVELLLNLALRVARR